MNIKIFITSYLFSPGSIKILATVKEKREENKLRCSSESFYERINLNHSHGILNIIVSYRF